jgi:hypothetical protein
LEDVENVIKNIKSYVYNQINLLKNNQTSRKPRHYSHWTDDEEKQLICSIESNKSIDDIANEHLRSQNAITSRLRKLPKVPL